MANGFRGLISSAMAEDVQARRAVSLSQSLPLALQQVEKGFARREKRQLAGERAAIESVARQEAGAIKSKQIAAEAVYKQYPGMAARDLGVEVPEGMVGDVVPSGFRPVRAKDGSITYEPIGPTKWELQKEARMTVNAMLNNNPKLQMQAFDNPQLITNLIDNEVSRLSEQYKLRYEDAASNIPGQITDSDIEAVREMTGNLKINRRNIEHTATKNNITPLEVLVLLAQEAQGK